ncbi:hypothetical protein GJR96_07145 [Haloferax sp. MBLA0076]|uniref:Uncharacterized protein n=1 Tax=Haloferax litoreum TaxID=2666140 RepID=A0A6A8GJ42_9EURY|nr:MULTISPECIES: hypothetical protein [Haloferax]KAB1193231.1 hypothetical protein Hfx1148_07140 [Haloferax sp. CBA1148]MRX21730.1 hypothetical protein [Haloferax litoreum]
MKRRDVLAGLTGSAALSLSGCITTPEPCVGETWTGLGYAVRLGDIASDADGNRWSGTCALDVDFSYVSGDGPDITNAGIALYAQNGTRVGLVRIGDVTWADVSDEDRREMSCGGYQRGSTTVRRDFDVDEFPYYLGLWYEQIRTGALEHASGLTYSDGSLPQGTVSPSSWDSTLVSRDPFPPLPESDPKLGTAISAGKLVTYYRICEREEPSVVTTACCDVGVRGTLPTPNPNYVAEFRGARLTRDGTTAVVRVAVREFQRPPETTCDDGETAVLGYTVGLSFDGERPTSFELVHLSADGTEVERFEVQQ